MLREYLHRRATKHGLHGHAHVNRQRRSALIMVITGAVRAVAWLALTVAYLTHVGIAVRLFASVSFVAVLSSLALAETAWSQVAGSLAQLTAGDAHQDAEAARRVEIPDLNRIIDRIDELETQLVHGGHRAEPEREPPCTG